VNTVYDRDGITLIHGDARDVIATPGESFDAVVTDPPYGETSLAWDRWPDGWPASLVPVLKPSGSLWCFGSLRMFLDRAAEFAAWRMAQDLVWEKQNGSGFHADRFKRVHEHAVQFYPTIRTWADVYKLPVTTNDALPKTVRRKERPPHLGEIAEKNSIYRSIEGGPRLMRSVLRVKNCHGVAVHPTQKPDGVVSPLLRYSVPPGGVVFDPFAGSGTTLLVARDLGLRAVGVEISADYCAAAVQRLNAPRQKELI